MLPSRTTDFASPEYWDEFFVVEKNKPKPSSFEWYGKFERDLLPLVQSHSATSLKQKQRALVLGCGNSSLSAELIDLAFATSVVSVDFSKQAIEMMTQWTAKRNYAAGALEWVLGDVTKLPKEFTGAFDQVWDKGSLDALTGSEELDLDNARAMLREARRALVGGGKYYCVSLLQHHVLCVLLDECTALFSQIDFMPFVPYQDDSNQCTFLIVMTANSNDNKCQYLLRGQPVVEDNSRLTVEEFVRSSQLAYLDKKQIRQHWRANSTVGQFSIRNTAGERFRLHIVDGALGSKAKIPFAVLILPRGREHEWSFAQLEGQLGLANAQGIGRLVLCTLGRDQHFASMKAVQDELSAVVLDFKPMGASAKNIPYLGIREELGQRTVLETGSTALNGPYSVEEVLVGKDRLRRLVFMDNALAVQSEAVVVGEEKKVDVKELSFDIHHAMVEFVRPLCCAEEQECSVLVCGVGGGGLVSYLSQLSPRPPTALHSVEIDQIVVDLARKWFAFDSSVVVADALEYLNSYSSAPVDVLILDINSGQEEADGAAGLICPPSVFLLADFLANIKSTVLHPERGRLVLNFACRSLAQRGEYLRRIRKLFPAVVAVDMKAWNGEDLNMILCCSVAASKQPVQLDSKSEFADAFRVVKEDGTLVLPQAVASSSASASAKKKVQKKNKKRG